MCVETLSVYFSKRAPPPTHLPHHFQPPFKPGDMATCLSNLVIRMFHNDRSLFLGPDTDPKEQPPPPSAATGETPGPATYSPSNSHITWSESHKTLDTTSTLPTLHGPSIATIVQAKGEVGVRHEFRWKDGTVVSLLGSFTEWKEERMTFEFATEEHSLTRVLMPGIHLYCFRVGSKLRIDKNKPMTGEGLNRRNILVVSCLCPLPLPLRDAVYTCLSEAASIPSPQVWRALDYEGPTRDDLRVDLCQQNIQDHGTWFLFSSIRLTRPVITELDLSFNKITSYGE